MSRRSAVRSKLAVGTLLAGAVWGDEQACRVEDVRILQADLRSAHADFIAGVHRGDEVFQALGVQDGVVVESEYVI